MAIAYHPSIDPAWESLIEQINPPRVSIENDACRYCTVVKVDSVNKDGILLEMVQVLTDLDLVITRSYIASDGSWFMDVFHVTDQQGNKLTNGNLILYIQQALCANKRAVMFKELKYCLPKEVRPCLMSLEQTALEITGTDRRGMLSEVSAVLAELGCHITTAIAWSHNARVACIIHIEDGAGGGPITNTRRLADVKEQLENLLGAHHSKHDRSVRLAPSAASQTHIERRLHQLLFSDMDYELCHGCNGAGVAHKTDCNKIHVSIESCREKGYSIVNVRSRDRPQLLFDTICALTEMQYSVFHASVSSRAKMADQEYFIRHKGRCTLDTESERQKLSQFLVAAIERRASHGLRLDISTENRTGLLSEVTRVFRENGLSISRTEIGSRGNKAIGSFYVTDASGNDLDLHTIDLVRNAIGGSISVVNLSSELSTRHSKTASSNGRRGDELHDKPQVSLGSLLWSQLERLLSNFGFLRS